MKNLLELINDYKSDFEDESLSYNSHHEAYTALYYFYKVLKAANADTANDDLYEALEDLAKYLCLN